MHAEVKNKLSAIQTVELQDKRLAIEKSVLLN